MSTKKLQGESDTQQIESPSKLNLISIDEAARYLDVPKSWLYKQTMIRAIPFYKVGKYNRFDRKELDTYLSDTCRRVPIEGGTRPVCK